MRDQGIPAMRCLRQGAAAAAAAAADPLRKMSVIGSSVRPSDEPLVEPVAIPVNPDALRKRAADLQTYIENNQDEVAQWDRWRTNMKKDISSKFAKQEKKLASVEAMVKDVHAMLTRMDKVHLAEGTMEGLG